MQDPVLRIQLNPTIKQDKAWEYLHDNVTTELLFGGGAGGGKSKLGCYWLTVSALQYPESRWLLGRSVLNTLKKSTLLTLFEVFKEFGLRRGNFTYNQQDNTVTIFNGSVIFLYDLAYYPSDPNYDRVGSTEFTGGFVDEANQITQKAKDVIKSRLRFKLTEFGLIPKLLLTCNPAKNYVYQEFYRPYKEGTLPPEKAFVQSLVTDNPYISPSYIDSLRKMKDKTLRERLLHGNWEYDDDPNALFSIDVITDLFTNTVDTSSERYITVDVARFGDDKTVIMVWEGLKVVRIKVFEKLSTVETEVEVRNIAAQERVPMSHVLVDEDGVGGGVVDHLACKGFVGASSPIRDEQGEQNLGYKVNYQNMRSQAYYTLAEYANQHKIAVSTENTEYRQFITEELEQIKAKDADVDGKLKIIGKDEIKEFLGRSTDFADCLAMRMWFELDKTPVPGIRLL